MTDVQPREEESDDVDLVIPGELEVESLGEYLQASWARLRGGDAGILPVVAGLILISALFQTLNSNFLTAGNLVNLLIQGSVYMLLAMGQVFPLLLGEIDLSIGFVSGIGGIIVAELVRSRPGGRGGPRCWWRCSPARSSVPSRGPSSLNSAYPRSS